MRNTLVHVGVSFVEGFIKPINGLKGLTRFLDDIPSAKAWGYCPYCGHQFFKCLNCGVSKMFEKEVFKIVKRHAFWAALAAGFLSYFIGIWQIIYIYSLWHMYNAICEKVGTKFTWSNVLTAVIVNVIVNLVLAYIPIGNIIVVYILDNSLLKMM